jgi:hypothetical protein
MDTGLSNSSLTIHLLIDDYRKGKEKNEDHLNVLWTRMETLASLLGARPPTLGPKFETPSVWAAVGLLATMMEKLAGKIKTMRPQVLIAQAKLSLGTMFVDKLSLLQEEGDKSQGNFRSAFVLASRALGKQIDDLKVLTVGHNISAPSSNKTKDAGHPEKKAWTTEETWTIFRCLEKLEALGRPSKLNPRHQTSRFRRWATSRQSPW